jgi:hypothetical protein
VDVLSLLHYNKKSAGLLQAKLIELELSSTNPWQL